MANKPAIRPYGFHGYPFFAAGCLSNWSARCWPLAAFGNAGATTRSTSGETRTKLSKVFSMFRGQWGQGSGCFLFPENVATLTNDNGTFQAFEDVSPSRKWWFSSQSRDRFQETYLLFEMYFLLEMYFRVEMYFLLKTYFPLDMYFLLELQFLLETYFLLEMYFLLETYFPLEMLLWDCSHCLPLEKDYADLHRSWCEAVQRSRDYSCGTRFREGLFCAVEWFPIGLPIGDVSCWKCISYWNCSSYWRRISHWKRISYWRCISYWRRISHWRCFFEIALMAYR